MRSKIAAGIASKVKAWNLAIKSAHLYRVAAVLLLLFAIGHTLGFRQSDPAWGVQGLLDSMQSIHFRVQGFDRTYWELFEAAGFSVGIFYLFAAILAWHLASLSPELLRRMRGTAWAFALCFVVIAAISYRYLFTLPLACSLAVSACLIGAAWRSSR